MPAPPLFVPDTDTFDLRTVAAVVYSTLPESTDGKSLLGCFTDADSEYFDPTYNNSTYAPANSLLRFRNYGSHNTPSIVADGNISISNVSTEDTVEIDVTPDTMGTSCYKVDTGDGTTWFKIIGLINTGDFTLTVQVFGTPPTSNKSAQVRIVDTNPSTADDCYVWVTYLYSV